MAKTPETEVPMSITHGAWPLVGLDKAIDFAEDLHQVFAGSDVFIQRIMETLIGRQDVSQQIGAAVHYGLLKKFKGKYQFTRLFLQYKAAMTGLEKRELLLQMFGYPSL